MKIELKEKTKEQVEQDLTILFAKERQITIEQKKKIERLTKELEEKEAILGGIQQLEAKIERLNSIIKEAREFIYKCNDGKQGINYSGCSELLEILDKVGETDVKD